MKSKEANKTNSSVHFLGESMARQSAFQFYLTFRTGPLSTSAKCVKELLQFFNNLEHSSEMFMLTYLVVVNKMPFFIPGQVINHMQKVVFP